jgi:hypothetical protein
MISKSKITSDLEYLSSELQDRRQEAIESSQEHVMSRVARGDFRELTDRDGGRRDIRFQLDRFPFTAPGLVYNPIVYPLIRELLGGGDDVNLLYAGVMWALPQPKPKKVSIDSVSQKWHADGGHLFDHLHLPPHCINVFYPLIDLTPEHGPTEVMTGTHRQGKLKDDSAPKIKLCCDAGSAILFDYRLNHSGSANFTSEARPVLYLCYAKPFFRDAGNTRSDLSIISTTSSKSCSKSSPSWVARILNGEPESMGEGFECAENESDESRHGESSNHCDDMVNDKTGDSALPIFTKNGANNGSGERWILFKMNVELPGSEGNPKVITIYHGDVAVEVSSQFCKKNGLGEEFIPVLAQSIDAQMSASLKQNS